MAEKKKQKSLFVMLLTPVMIKRISIFAWPLQKPNGVLLNDSLYEQHLIENLISIEKCSFFM